MDKEKVAIRSTRGAGTAMGVDGSPPQHLDLSPAALYPGLAEVASALYKQALTTLPPDVRVALKSATEKETKHQAKMRLEVMNDAINVSDRTGIIVCQDTGIPVFFVDMGTEFPINGARLQEALTTGIELATERFSLRSSVVHPVTRHNPQTSTGRGIPVFHLGFTDGADWIDILLVPKGSGSENM